MTRALQHRTESTASGPRTPTDKDDVGVLSRSVASLQQVNDTVLRKLPGAIGYQSEHLALGRGAEPAVRSCVDREESTMIDKLITGMSASDPGAQCSLGQRMTVDDRREMIVHFQ